METDNAKELINICKVDQTYSVYVIFNVSYNHIITNVKPRHNNQVITKAFLFCLNINGYMLCFRKNYISENVFFYRTILQIQMCSIKTNTLINKQMFQKA